MCDTKNKKIIYKHVIKYLIFFAGAVFFAVLLRVFFIASYKIPSESMAPTILTGDFVLVNKLIPGPRILKNYDFVSEGGKPDMWRPSGYRTIRRNDVLVFNSPYARGKKLHPDINVHYIKRCVAVPGDTFYIENGINRVKGLTDTLGVYSVQEKLSLTDSRKIAPEVLRAFPKNRKHLNWNIKDFGPFYIPRKGDIIPVDTVNIAIYKITIEYETGGRINTGNKGIYLNDSLITEYRFPQNYYFMTGDNVFDSKDSRYWGLLPEDHIIGKAFVIWKSKDAETNETRWNRIFKLLK